ncbi:glycosyltransferase family 2 protein [Ignavigranum ruoffiae]|uniref:Glycosyltransferase 2-like domain-containing protein n=1 Tax=Ignavigranum ruoffiae TaxID=89093 RepID=A0A1H9CNT6_9LACT|nr:glycosyltransferase family A protein [Ignavigranum ruoffiae]SEQ02870.1 hypothetical protein SAMN04488558_10494 [Ignavigranum ruoffiae]
MQITILTPAYNRADYLQPLYRSLQDQSMKGFQWLIIDDGSQDQTETVVNQMMSQHNQSFQINYYRKENGGKHSALNYAHPYIQGDYVMVVDSDDQLAPQAIEIMSQAIEDLGSATDSIGWLAFLKWERTGQVIDPPYRQDGEVLTYIDYLNGGRKGECADLYQSQVFKTYPYPEIPGERFVSEAYLNIYAAVEGQYRMKTLNQVIQITEYYDQGLTSQGRRLQLASPIGNAKLWQAVAGAKFSWKMQVKGMLLYLTYGLVGNQTGHNLIRESRNPFLARLILPASQILKAYWISKYRLEEKK